MSVGANSFEIIDRIYDVAVDPARYEGMLDVWEQRLSSLRMSPDAAVSGRIPIDAELQTHLDRATVFLQRLDDARPDVDRSLLDLDVRAAFLVDDRLNVLQTNRAAYNALRLRDGDTLDRLPLFPEDVATLRAGIRRMLGSKTGEPLLLRFVSAVSERSVVFHIARQRQTEERKQLVLVRTTEFGWPNHLSQSMRDAFQLTPAEVEVVRELAEGLSLREIAKRQKRSIETVKTHLSAALGKTGTRTQAELIRLTLGLMDVVGTSAWCEGAVSSSENLDPIPFRTLMTADGRRYDWIEFGDSAGRPCLYLPMDYGLIRWPRQAEMAAVRRGIRVIVPIRAGYGYSSPMPHTSLSYVEATSADLLGLLDHLGIHSSAILPIGADLRFALALAASAPDRITGILGCSTALPVVTVQQYERMGKWHRFILANARYAPQILPFLVKAGFALARRIGKDKFFLAVQAGSPGDMRTFSDPAIREAILLGSDVCLRVRWERVI